ncbi:hypothetical protein HMPREF9622_01960 [Cutibacterium modestum HL037PA3]|nr:hypothetical protein HMPREF9622_01960 [Cutibacterium modestum HL037PA3]
MNDANPPREPLAVVLRLDPADPSPHHGLAHASRQVLLRPSFD